MSCNETVTVFDIYHYEPNQNAAIIFIIQYAVLTAIGIYFLIKYKEYQKVGGPELPSEHVVILEGEPNNNSASLLSTPSVILQSEHLPITWLSQGYRVILTSKLAAIHLLAGFILRIVFVHTETTFFFGMSNAYILLVPVGIAYLNDSILLMLIRASEQIEPHLAKNGSWYFRSRSLQSLLRNLDRISLVLIPMSFGQMTDKDPNTRKSAQYMQAVGFIAQFIQIIFVARVTHMVRGRDEYRLSRPQGLTPLFRPLLFSSLCIFVRNTYRVVSVLDPSGDLLTHEWLFYVADMIPEMLVLVTYIIYNPLPYVKQAISEMDVDLPAVASANASYTSPRSQNESTSQSKFPLTI